MPLIGAAILLTVPPIAPPIFLTPSIDFSFAENFLLDSAALIDFIAFFSSSILLA